MVSRVQSMNALTKVLGKKIMVARVGSRGGFYLMADMK
jgi:hypothetical protein